VPLWNITGQRNVVKPDGDNSDAILAVSYDRRKRSVKRTGINVNRMAKQAGSFAAGLDRSRGGRAFDRRASFLIFGAVAPARDRSVGLRNGSFRRGAGLRPSLVVSCGMPRFFFNFLRDSDVVSDPGGGLFECAGGATAAADELACARPRLHGGGGCIRVGNNGGQEGHRSAIDPAPIADGTTSAGGG
jgi:hypothetical protein